MQQEGPKTLNKTNKRRMIDTKVNRTKRKMRKRMIETKKRRMRMIAMSSWMTTFEEHQPPQRGEVVLSMAAREFVVVKALGLDQKKRKRLESVIWKRQNMNEMIVTSNETKHSSHMNVFGAKKLEQTRPPVDWQTLVPPQES